MVGLCWAGDAKGGNHTLSLTDSLILQSALWSSIQKPNTLITATYTESHCLPGKIGVFYDLLSANCPFAKPRPLTVIVQS